MNFHAGTLDDQAPRPASRPQRSRELAIYLLTPGFSTAYHAHALGVSTTTINKHISWSQAAALADPSIVEDAALNAASIIPEDGLKMAQRRGSAHLPWWSRLAMADFAVRLGSTCEVAKLFRCSRRTVQLVRSRGVLSYDLFTGARRLSWTQASPPGKWTSRGGQ
jgi:hypothetical protein